MGFIGTDFKGSCHQFIALTVHNVCQQQPLVLHKLQLAAMYDPSLSLIQIQCTSPVLQFPVIGLTRLFPLLTWCVPFHIPFLL